MENYNIGTFVPQCKPDGRYEEVQCGAGWDSCWCVDATGTELPGTKRKGWPQCGKRNLPEQKKYYVFKFFDRLVDFCRGKAL